MYFLLNMVIFHCYVNLPEGTQNKTAFLFQQLEFGWNYLPGLEFFGISSNFPTKQIRITCRMEFWTVCNFNRSFPGFGIPGLRGDVLPYHSFGQIIASKQPVTNFAPKNVGLVREFPRKMTKHCRSSWQFFVTFLGWLSDPFQVLSDLQYLQVTQFSSPGNS